MPELVQEQVTPENLGAAVLRELSDEPRRAGLVAEFTRIHQTLRQDASGAAADAILGLLAERGVAVS